MLTPETEHDREALSYITPGEVLKTVVKSGTFVYDEDKHVGIHIAECKGGYYRQFPDGESLMFVIKNKPLYCPRCGAGFYKDTFHCPRCGNNYTWNGIELELHNAVAPPPPTPMEPEPMPATTETTRPGKDEPCEI